MRETDLETVGKLWLALADYHAKLDPEMPIPAPDGTARYTAHLDYRLDDSLCCAFIAEEAGELVGYVTGMIVDLMPDVFVEERAGMIGDIYVLPEYRRQGTAHALLSATLDWFRLREVGYYEWYVANANPAGRAFWRNVGGRDVMTRMRATIEGEDLP
jgi:GNAT superfamily N-acetyltransferase